MNIKLKILSFLIIVGYCINTYAQQEPQFSQYLYNKLYFNPAYAGSEYKLQATGVFRNQWVGFEGAPLTGVLTVDASVDALHGGIGGTFFYDAIGLIRTTGFKVAYAYKINLGNGFLQSGLDVGLINSLFLGSKAKSFDPNDPSIPNEDVRGNVLTFGIGSYYYSDNFYAGLSITNLFEPTFKDLNIQLRHHYYGIAGYNIVVDSVFSIQPSILIKSDGYIVQVDLTANFYFYNTFWIGSSYRPNDAIVILAGFRFKKIRIAYSYDIITSAIKNYSSGSHEVVLSFLIDQN